MRRYTHCLLIFSLSNIIIRIRLPLFRAHAFLLHMGNAVSRY